MTLGAKDISQRELAEYEDTFADIVNVLLLGGKRLISPEELKAASIQSSYKDKNLRLRTQERDVAKFWQRCEIIIAMFGIENQISVHRAMPLRLMGYDGAAYRSQLNGIKPEDELWTKENQEKLPLYPVITLVLHFDYKRRWTAPKTLKECFRNIPPELEPYINDYKMNLFEVAWLPDETVSMFQSDFRFVADYYRQMRKTGKWRPMPGEVAHIKELFDMFNALTGDKRFMKMYDNLKGDERDMSCVALDYLAAEYADKFKADLTAKITADIVPKLRAKLKADLTAEITTELSPQIRAELSPQIRAELSPQIRAELSAEYADLDKKIRDEAMTSSKIDTALTMFSDNVSIDKIAKYSHLSIEEVTDIGKKHGYIQ